MIHSLDGCLCNVMITSCDISRDELLCQKVDKSLGKNHC